MNGKKGVPIRVELGPKDIANQVAVLVRRDTGDKKSVLIADLEVEVVSLLKEIQGNLYSRALEYQKKKTINVDTWIGFKKEIEAGNFVMAHWSGKASTEKEIKEETGATIRCIPFKSEFEKGACIKSGNPSERRVLFAKSY